MADIADKLAGLAQQMPPANFRDFARRGLSPEAQARFDSGYSEAQSPILSKLLPLLQLWRGLAGNPDLESYRELGHNAAKLPGDYINQAKPWETPMGPAPTTPAVAPSAAPITAPVAPAAPGAPSYTDERWAEAEAAAKKQELINKYGEALLTAALQQPRTR